MKLSVIIPCYNPRDTLAEQLEALTVQHWPDGWEVLLADNRSTDRFEEVAETFRDKLPGLRIIPCLAKQGPGYARNTAAKAATGEGLVFCDADDVAGPAWLQSMGDALRENEIVAGRLDVTRINPTWAIRSRPEIEELQTKGVMRTHDFLPWASSSNLGIQKKVFLEAGGFDEALPTVEDVDLCWRLQSLGAKLAFAPDALMHYRLRTSYRGIFRQSQSYAENFVFLYKRYKALGLSPPVPSVRSLLRHWYHLARNCPIRAAPPERTGEWLWEAGWRWGSLRGSVKYRLFVP